ncbi:pentapeptide repeat-containing protein [Streptomyces sp. NPDC051366]|uniref:pentapeptide repeat-containing protein n=1 Tax=Streptomyces sp. NPDC051366 TaxID=3365652 RepID=UPI0037A00906
MRTALLGIGAGSLAAVGIVYTHRTLHQNREGQVTDRYTRAITQIASEKRVEQLGGIYALERIMRDSERDHVTIVEVLAAFVREHAPAPGERTTPSAPQAAEWSGPGASQSTRVLRPEPVEAALAVLLRRPQNRHETFHLNLTETDLRQAVLSEAPLGKANLTGAHMQKAQMRKAHLENALLGWARLEEANLERADLQEAFLTGARLKKTNLKGANLRKANLFGAHLEETELQGATLDEADLFGADLRTALHLTVEQLVSACPSEHTSLPAHLAQDARVVARINAADKERVDEAARRAL